ncbi:MAG: hypothetical protein IJJ33_10850 [Victivallales bacterium]|nr:hypothetical protein [Victivallales bacterium]
MLEITNVRQGAILNHNHGQETKDSLVIRLEGLSDAGYPVKINGVPAVMDGRRFACELALTKKLNAVTASVLTPFGTFSQEITLVWDKASFKRVNCYIDDHSFFWTDLAKQRPARAFDHFYLAHFKRLHELYGFKCTFNCFYRNDHDNGFLMSEMPDIWKQEFTDNADWCKFSFHSYSEFPDRPYVESSAEEFLKDYRLVKEEITRWGGEAAFGVPNVIHWANIHPACAQALIDLGCKCYSRNFRPRVMGGPSLADRTKGGCMAEVEKRSMSNVDKEASTEGLKLHYDVPAEVEYLTKHGAYYDPALGICFATGIFCGNLVPLDKTIERLTAGLERLQANGVEAVQYGSHEQYSFPYNSNYQPDHLQRMETAARFFHEQGYQHIFFNDGFLGNTAWEK